MHCYCPYCPQHPCVYVASAHCLVLQQEDHRFEPQLSLMSFSLG